MVVDLEVLPPCDGSDRFGLEAEVQLDHTAAPGAEEVVVMVVAFAEAKAVRPVGKLDAIQDLHACKLLD